jgi:hypothetical protein
MSSHAENVRMGAEISKTFLAKEFTGNDSVASTAETTADNVVRDENSKFLRLGARTTITEKRWSIVHEGVKPAHPGESGMEGWLVAGEQRLWSLAYISGEVLPEGGNLAADPRSWSEFDNIYRMSSISGDVTVIDIGDDMVIQTVLIEPVGESEDAAFRTAKLLDLRDKDCT